jgi:hypothetical protein
MTSKSSQYSVDLSHNQLSFLHAILLQYQQVWSNKDNKLPAHVDDLLQTTLHQLVSCRKQTSK